MTLSKILLAVVALTLAQGGDDWSALVEQALDQPTSLSFENGAQIEAEIDFA